MVFFRIDYPLRCDIDTERVECLWLVLFTRCFSDDLRSSVSFPLHLITSDCISIFLFDILEVLKLNISSSYPVRGTIKISVSVGSTVHQIMRWSLGAVEHMLNIDRLKKC